MGQTEIFHAAYMSLFGALDFKTPYDYYVFFRWIVCPCLAFAVIQAFNQGKTGWGMDSRGDCRIIKSSDSFVIEQGALSCCRFCSDGYCWNFDIYTLDKGKLENLISITRYFISSFFLMAAPGPLFLLMGVAIPLSSTKDAVKESKGNISYFRYDRICQ